MKNILILIFLLTVTSVNAQEKIERNRVDKAKSSIVKILIDGKTFGTGFFINGKGQIATCWHVIAPAITKNQDGDISIKKIEVEFADGYKHEVGIHNYYLNAGIVNAFIYDYCLLQPLRKIYKHFDFYLLGDYAKTYEGEVIFTAGYPLQIEQLIFATGIISSKWSNKIKMDTTEYNRNSYWLDCTLNKGNSGAPIILKGDSIDNDRVIGIATFIETPYFIYLNKLEEDVLKKDISLKIGALDQMYVNRLFGSALKSNSVGLSGAVSIEYFKQLLE